MPSIICGPIKINSISNAAQLNFGDALNISPKNNSKTNGGAGAFPTGDLQNHYEFMSSTNVFDPDGTDETMVANN